MTYLNNSFDLNLEMIKFFFFIVEKDEVNDFRGGASKPQSKSQTASSSLAVTRSDHLMKLNLDIGSMVEVSYRI